jgi:tRNA U34 5-carboxymethylaminomethyl modifying enzyme MnmG/GidA
MNLLKSLGGLITEIAALDQVQDSIRNKKVIAIYYDGNDNGGNGAEKTATQGTSGRIHASQCHFNM